MELRAVHFLGETLIAYFSISPITCFPLIQEIGGVVLITAEFRNILTGLLAAPGTSIQIEITGPDGVVKTAYTAMTADTTTGRYYYAVVSSTSYSPGFYTVRCQCVDGGNTTPQVASNAFQLTGNA